MTKSLTAPVKTKISEIIANAHAHGRDMLFEHEVYAILKLLSLTIPHHCIIKDADEITDRCLSQFGSDKIVLKIVAPEITHKGQVDGVHMVLKDKHFIKFSYNRMLSTFRSQGLTPEGVLFVEYVPYSQALGNETLLGFRESESFGPVLSFSKGGHDAEHFAQHFSPPNLILAPVNKNWAQALLASTHIQKKYIAQGHTNYIDKIISAGIKFSQLSVSFSHFFKADTDYVISEFEVNPFVFTPEGAFTALDGYARFSKRLDPPKSLNVQSYKSIIPFFKPRGIAVIGLSATNPSKTGNIIMRNLLKLGRTDVFGVNPKGGQTLFENEAHPLYHSVMDIDQHLDLAVITVPAESTLEVIKSCTAKKIAAAIIIPAGFNELNPDSHLEEMILDTAQRHHMRIIGPNCLGILSAGDDDTVGINTFFIPEEKFPVNLEKANNVAIISQSGALGIVELEMLKNAIAPKVIVSYGNQLDVDPCDLINYLERDPNIDVIGCYIEGFKRDAGRKFFNLAAKSKKPIIVYKAGRTEAGRRATESHTASIAGEYAVAKAAMKQAGIIVAETMLDHGDYLKTFAMLNDFKVSGNRVAIIANAGYEKTYAADNLGDLQIATFDEVTYRNLKCVLPEIVEVSPLLDLTPMADDAMFAKSIEIILKCDSVDALLVSVVPHSTLLHTTNEEIDRDPNNIAARIVRQVQRLKKPTVASINVVSGVDAIYNRLGQTLSRNGIPTFISAQRAMLCLDAFIRYRRLRQAGAHGDWLK